MSRDGDKSAKTSIRNQKQARTQPQVCVLKKKKEKSVRDEISTDPQSGHDSGKEIKSAGAQGKRAEKVWTGATVEGERSPAAQRKLSDASNASEDLSKDSGCASGKLSSDSSSEISDCTSEGNKQESPSCDNELSWTDGRAYVQPDSEGAVDGKACVKATGDPRAPKPDAAGGGLGLFNSSGTFLELMMGETSDDLAREVEDLRSENEYLKIYKKPSDSRGIFCKCSCQSSLERQRKLPDMDQKSGDAQQWFLKLRSAAHSLWVSEIMKEKSVKDEVEELRCEMLEMRDMFQEEEVYQLQELRLQLEQANKTCRILQYRLRKAERRSIRVAQTGQVDGELVRSLEHDIKVAKSVSLRLYNELEVVQKKNAQLEWENEMLREKTQAQEVARQVLQAEVDKAREGTLKRKSIRSAVSKAEKRLSQQIEDDSADLRCQLHFAKEELALMCKKLTKLVSESEVMREELAKYRSAFGDVDANSFPEGKRHSARAREAEVKVHLKLVEEEATLLSRRIVELEVENRGLRGEMSDLREKVGRGEEEEEENQEVSEENVSASTQAKERDGREQGLKKGCKTYQDKDAEKSNVEKSSRGSKSWTETKMPACHTAREGPVGGEWDPSDPLQSENKKLDGELRGMTVNDFETLLALRDHSCILSSAIQFLMPPTKNGHSSPSSAFTSPTETDSSGKVHKIFPPAPLNEALELLQAMLTAFIGRLETLLTDRQALESNSFSFLPGESSEREALRSQVEDLRTPEVKEREKQTGQASSSQCDTISSCRDPKMRLSLQILWIIHQWCQVKGPGVEEKEVKGKTLSVLRGLLQDLGAELQDDPIDFGTQATATQVKAAEAALSSIFQDNLHSTADRAYSSSWRRRQFPPHSCKKKNWYYVSQEAAQLDREDPVKTWDHLIMPLSFPDLDFEQMSLERSHTAPEKSSFRIYYSPPSARRVQLAQQKQRLVTDTESFNSASSWCTPLTSFSQLCLDSAHNLSDDMKEMTASWKQAVQGSSQEGRGRVQGRRQDGVCSCTQANMKPQMVSVGLQTDGTHGSVTMRNSPSRILSPSLISTRSQHFSASLDKSPSRGERSRTSTSSPKLYRRHSSSSSPSSSNNISPSSSSQSTSRDRALWNMTHSQSSLSWSRQSSLRGQNQSPVSGTKPQSKPVGPNRYGMVTEFLRRVSGRVDKPAPVTGQKMKSGLKSPERVPTRPPAAPLQRSDSVTRIVNQRFMKQREEAGRAQREEKGGSLSPSVRQSPSTSTSEEGNYDCSSSGTLTFCFSRPSRFSQRQTSNPSKLPLHRYSPPVSVAGESACDS